MLVPKRHEASGKYRYGFNGMEKDDEVKGQGNSYTTQFSAYDPRIGRWLSLDPLMGKYPNQSPFAGFNNNPIYFKDPTGLEGGPPKKHIVEKGYTLGKLAKKHNTTVDNLVSWNGIKDKDHIEKGWDLYVENPYTLGKMNKLTSIELAKSITIQKKKDNTSFNIINSWTSRCYCIKYGFYNSWRIFPCSAI